MRVASFVAVLALIAAAAQPERVAHALGRSQPTPAATATADGPIFAVEIRIGPKWDTSKATEEQAFFREHSANLRQLREQGALVVGARYSDKGFLVLSAPSLEAARAMLDRDPSIAADVFAYEVHEMSVFYPGTVPSRRR